MKMLLNKSTTLILVFSLATVGPLLAQKRSQISIHTGGFYCFLHNGLVIFPNGSLQGVYGGGEVNKKNAYDPLAMKGIKYQYRITHHFSGYGNFSMSSQGYLDFSRSHRFPLIPKPLEEKYIKRDINGNLVSYTNPDGRLDYRYGYYFFDLGAIYGYFINPRNKLSAQLGLSYSYGYNEYVYKIIFFGNRHITHLLAEDHRANYWGAVAGLSYDYYFWKERLNVGANFNFRYYTKDLPSFIDYSVHIGFNF